MLSISALLCRRFLLILVGHLCWLRCIGLDLYDGCLFLQQGLRLLPWNLQNNIWPKFVMQIHALRKTLFWQISKNVILSYIDLCIHCNDQCVNLTLINPLNTLHDKITYCKMNIYESINNSTKMSHFVDCMASLAHWFVPAHLHGWCVIMAGLWQLPLGVTIGCKVLECKLSISIHQIILLA